MALLKIVVPFLPGSVGSKDGVPASTRTAPVLTSSATTAPLRPWSASVATFWAFGSSVVCRLSPTVSLETIESISRPSSSLRPTSASLYCFSRPARPSWTLSNPTGSANRRPSGSGACSGRR